MYFHPLVLRHPTVDRLFVNPCTSCCDTEDPHDDKPRSLLELDEPLLELDHLELSLLLSVQAWYSRGRTLLPLSQSSARPFPWCVASSLILLLWLRVVVRLRTWNACLLPPLDFFLLLALANPHAHFLAQNRSTPVHSCNVLLVKQCPS